jgi:DNA-binding transcriptional MerR regulator
MTAHLAPAGPPPAAEPTNPEEAAAAAVGSQATEVGADRPGNLVSIGAAALALGVSERALRYYQQLGLIDCGRTPGGMRRYSPEDLARVTRIRELQSLLGLDLDEIAVVLRNDDRLAEIRQVYHDARTGAEERAELARECLALQEHLRLVVQAKRGALDNFLADLDARIARIRDVIDRDAPASPEPARRSRARTAGTN